MLVCTGIAIRTLNSIESVRADLLVRINLGTIGHGLEPAWDCLKEPWVKSISAEVFKGTTIRQGIFYGRTRFLLDLHVG